MNCVYCDGEVIIKRVSYYYKKIIYFGDFEAEVCTQCGETFFTEESFKLIEIFAKEIGVWGSNKINFDFSEKSIRNVNVLTNSFLESIPILTVPPTTYRVK